MNPAIRPVDARRDLDAVADLIEVCFAGTLDEDGRRYIEQLRQTAQEARRLGWALDIAEPAFLPLQGFLWEEGGRMVGNLSLIPLRKDGRPVQLIANVAVLPEYRRRGIAEQLTLRAVAHIRRTADCPIWLQVREDNPAAVALYRKLGFSDRTRRTTWHHTYLDLLPPLPPEQAAVPCRREDWPRSMELLQCMYPENVRWNLQVDLERFRPDLLTAFLDLVTEPTHRCWVLREGTALKGCLAWEAARSWADNLWLGCEAADAEGVLRALLPAALRGHSRMRPQAINLAAGTGAAALREAGFQPHYTLIWMEMENTKPAGISPAPA